MIKLLLHLGASPDYCCDRGANARLASNTRQGRIKHSSFVNNKSKSYLSISLVENPDLKVDLVVQIINKLHAHFVNNCSVAQRKRVGLITQRSQDRNLVEQLFSASVPERSKGLDSSSSVFVLEGSNPSRCIPFY